MPAHPTRISLSEAATALARTDRPFVELFGHGTLVLEYYRPVQADLQQPHTRDEVYIIASGSGIFYCEGQTTPFATGDFLFVPAGADHRFVSFSDDFATWVLFYGPEGGEAGPATTTNQFEQPV